MKNPGILSKNLKTKLIQTDMGQHQHYLKPDVNTGLTTSQRTVLQKKGKLLPKRQNLSVDESKMQNLIN